VAAAAGIATLKIIRDTDACERASKQCEKLRLSLNTVLEEEGVPWAVYGEYSCFNIFTNPDGHPVKATNFDHHAVPFEWFDKPDKRERMLSKLVLGLLTKGVDPKSYKGGFMSSAHSDSDIELTVDAWRNTLRELKAEGDLQ
jgi:glutamate-1-semialdehyde 2,1-aminomutase